MGEISENGKAASVAVYGSPQQMATLLASVAQLIGVEPDETWEDTTARMAARGLAGLLHERLASTVQKGTE